VCQKLCEKDECIVEQAASWAEKRGIEPEDARQQAWVFLLEAREDWKPERGRWGMFAFHAIRSAFIDLLRARSKRVQAFDCDALDPWMMVGVPREEERLDAKRSLARLVAGGMDVAAAVDRGAGPPFRREKWGV
jgi:DNA-directed RNA polymerase specialized sigma24 family protein